MPQFDLFSLFRPRRPAVWGEQTPMEAPDIQPSSQPLYQTNNQPNYATDVIVPQLEEALQPAKVSTGRRVLAGIFGGLTQNPDVARGITGETARQRRIGDLTQLYNLNRQQQMDELSRRNTESEIAYRGRLPQQPNPPAPHYYPGVVNGKPYEMSVSPGGEPQPVGERYQNEPAERAPVVRTMGNRTVERQQDGSWKDVGPAPDRGTEPISMTPEAIDMAAQAYVTSGQLPALGMGNAGLRQQILNRAGQIASGTGAPPSGAGSNVITNKAKLTSLQGALTQIQRNRTAVSAFESTAKKNLDIFENAASKIIDTGSPWINKPLRAIDRNALGSADQAAFDVAYRIALTESARVLNNPNLVGILSDTARQELETAHSPNATLKQIAAAVKVLKQDMENRKSALDAEADSLVQEIASVGSGQRASQTQGNAPISLERGPDGKLRPKKVQ